MRAKGVSLTQVKQPNCGDRLPRKGQGWRGGGKILIMWLPWNWGLSLQPLWAGAGVSQPCL